MAATKAVDFWVVAAATVADHVSVGQILDATPVTQVAELRWFNLLAAADVVNAASAFLASSKIA